MMLINSPTEKLWPVHLKPKEDELLSSWLSRLAIAHGLKLSKFFSSSFSHLGTLKNEAWNRDIDKSSPLWIFEILAGRTGTPLNRVIATGLSIYEGMLYQRNNLCGNTQWIMPVGSNRHIQHLFGLQFCPYCLMQDEEPYFRRNWRLACIVLCIKHRIRLLDRCYRCGAAVKFNKGLTGFKCDLPSYGITICHSCKTDLRTAATSKLTTPALDAEVMFQDDLMRIIKDGYTEIPESGVIYSHLYFDVLYKLINLFTGGNKAVFRRENINRYFKTNNFTQLFKATKHPHFEHLRVDIRLELMGATRLLLRNWPNNFIKFCKDARLSSETLFKHFDDVPFWFWSVVHDHLTRTRYKHTIQEVQAALNCMSLIRQKYPYRPHRFPKDLRDVSEFLAVARMCKVWENFDVPNMRLKKNWNNARRSGKSKRSNAPQEPRLVPDQLWEKIKLLLPNSSCYSSNINRADDRKMLNGILYVICTSSSWSAVPSVFGSSSTVHRRFTLWKNKGILDELLARCSHIYER